MDPFAQLRQVGQFGLRCITTTPPRISFESGAVTADSEEAGSPSSSASLRSNPLSQQSPTCSSPSRNQFANRLTAVLAAANGSTKASLPAPFILKTFQLVENPATDRIVSWSAEGTSFIVWKQDEFMMKTLPEYFKHANLTSFIRQLNTYGFRKVPGPRFEFMHEHFHRGDPGRLTKIHRKAGNTSSQSGESYCGGKKDDLIKQNQTLLQEVESLRLERKQLQDQVLNLQKQRAHFLPGAVPPLMNPHMTAHMSSNMTATPLAPTSQQGGRYDMPPGLSVFSHFAAAVGGGKPGIAPLQVPLFSRPPLDFCRPGPLPSSVDTLALLNYMHAPAQPQEVNAPNPPKTPLSTKTLTYDFLSALDKPNSEADTSVA